MERKRHLIALDLDGTLLTNEKKISSHTKNVILKAKEQGHVVVIATGRPHRSSILYYRQLGLKTPMVNFNGALIHHPQDKKWEGSHNPLEQKTALNIVDACYDLSVNNLMAEVQDNVFLDKYDKSLLDIFLHSSEELPYKIG